MPNRKVLKINLIALVFLVFIIGCTPFLPVEETQPSGQIVIRITFPRQQTKVIPPETTYFEVALQREGSSSWTVQTFSVEEGTEQTAIFTVLPGTYRIDACAKTPHSGVLYQTPDQFLALGTTSVTVNAGETKSATVTLCPIYYDFTETTTQVTSTAPVVLSLKMKVPTPFSEDFTRSGIPMYGELANVLSDRVFFQLSTAGTETIDVPQAGGVEYTVMQFTSEEFSAPSVTATTTYTWYFDLHVASDKWIQCHHYSPAQTLTVVPGSGSGEIIIILQ